MRVKDIVGLENLKEQFLSRLVLKVIKGTNGPRLTLDLDSETFVTSEGEEREISRYFVPTGVLMFPIVKDPYMMAFSKSQQRKYWFNFMTKNSVFECPLDAIVDFKTSFDKRYRYIK